jgi:prepilin-type N-terminal cleavage/methylation domain-containing protein
VSWLRHRAGGVFRRWKPQLQNAFTLIELLTVVALIGILASLLLTALSSARKKSRIMLCTSNLHQVSLAVNMYVDDTSEQPGVTNLIDKNYLSSPKIVLCPEDKTENWGLLLQSPPQPINTTNTPPGQTFSYMMHPLGWDISLWKRLMHGPSWAGLSACQLHGLGNQQTSDAHNYSGLLLRAQRDGAVVRRQAFPASWSLAGLPNLPIGATNQPYLYPFQVYVDNPDEWLRGPP